MELPPTEMDTSAREATQACIERFETCICIEGLSGQRKENLENRLADMRLWADNVGALEQEETSLESRHPESIFQVVSLLKMTKWFLDRFHTIAKAGGGDAELRKTMKNINGMMETHAMLTSLLLWRPRTKSQLERADLSFESDRAGKLKRHCDELQTHLMCIIKSRPKEDARSLDYMDTIQFTELTDVQSRLIEANLRRWHRFQYAQLHSTDFRPAEIAQHTPLRAPQGDASAASTTEPERQLPPRVAVASVMPALEADSQGDARTATGMTASALGGGSQALDTRRNRQNEPTMTRSSTITGLFRFPSAKKSRKLQKTVLCPCCCLALPLKEVEDRDLWTEHIEHDLCPYTCIVEKCPDPYKLYATRKEWEKHVESDHRLRYVCSCCKGRRPIFEDRGSFMDHLEDKHPEHRVGENFARIMMLSVRKPAFGIKCCPLCNEKGPTDTRDLVDHVVGHVYNFSMYALPWRTIPPPGLNRQIRTCHDLPPEDHPDEKSEDAEARVYSHERILRWVMEPHPDEENISDDKKATLRDYDWSNEWDTPSALIDEDEITSLETEYYARTGVDYFEDDSNIGDDRSWSTYSTDTQDLSASSGSAPLDIVDDPGSLPHAGDELGQQAAVVDQKSIISRCDESADASRPSIPIDDLGPIESSDIPGPLYNASLEGDDDVVRNLLHNGADVNAQGGKFGNPLQAAASAGWENTVKLLLDAGAEVNAQGGFYGNALQAAASDDWEDTVKLLLDAGADVNAKRGQHGSALQAAIYHQCSDVVDILLDAGADPNAQGGEYGNPLQAAISRRDEYTIRRLLDSGADVNVQGGRHGFPLQAAAAYELPESVQWLLHAGAEPNAQGGEHGNALQAAMYFGCKDIVNILLDNGADINTLTG